MKPSILCVFYVSTLLLSIYIILVEAEEAEAKDDIIKELDRRKRCSCRPDVAPWNCPCKMLDDPPKPWYRFNSRNNYGFRRSNEMDYRDRTGDSDEESTLRSRSLGPLRARPSTVLRPRPPSFFPSTPSFSGGRNKQEFLNRRSRPRYPSWAQPPQITRTDACFTLCGCSRGFEPPPYY